MIRKLHYTLTKKLLHLKHILFLSKKSLVTEGTASIRKHLLSWKELHGQGIKIIYSYSDTDFVFVEFQHIQKNI